MTRQTGTVTAVMSQSRLHDVWVAPAPHVPHSGVEVSQSTLRGAGALAWPLAILLIVHRFFVLARTGSVTDDFTTVWSAARRFIERVPVYNETYAHVDPHYLYNPGATLLLSPLGLIPTVESARPFFIAFNAICIIFAIAWLTRLSGFRLSHPVLPIALTLAFLTEAVTNTLVFSNINGVLLLALTAFIASFLKGHDAVAGVVLGLAVVVKPMFAPLLILPLMKLRWKATATGIAIPILLNAIAWPLTPGARDYIDIVVPYLGITRDYANSSLAGFAVYFDMPSWAHSTLFMVAAFAVAAALLGLARWRYSDEWLWLTLSTGVLLAGVCLLSSLGQAYYSMMLFPALFTVFHRTSPLHTWPAWLGAILCLSPLNWVTPETVLPGRWLTTFLPTFGWAAFIVAIASWVWSMQIKSAPIEERAQQ